MSHVPCSDSEDPQRQNGIDKDWKMLEKITLLRLLCDVLHKVILPQILQICQQTNM
jgi:hypothetical protein